MRQLQWILLSGEAGSPDTQTAKVQEDGSYGELMDVIDHVLRRCAEEDEERGDP